MNHLTHTSKMLTENYLSAIIAPGVLPSDLELRARMRRKALRIVSYLTSIDCEREIPSAHAARAGLLELAKRPLDVFFRNFSTLTLIGSHYDRDGNELIGVGLEWIYANEHDDSYEVQDDLKRIAVMRYAKFMLEQRARSYTPRKPSSARFLARTGKHRQQRFEGFTGYGLG